MPRSAGTVDRMRRPSATVGLFTVGVLFLGLAWAGANPPAASPDEPAHVVKAYATGNGQVTGEHYSDNADAPPPATNEEAKQRKWFDAVGRSYRIPLDVQPGYAVPCYAFDRNDRASCLDDGHTAPTSESVDTQMGTYPPFLYVPTGVAMQGSSSFNQAETKGRLVDVVICTVLIVWAAILAWDKGRSPLSFVGLALGLTPMVIFLGATTSPNGVEIAAGICMWAALLHLTRTERTTSPKVAWYGLAAGGAVMELSRNLDPLFLVVAVVVALYASGRLRPTTKDSRTTWIEQAERAPRMMKTTIGILLVAGVVCVSWSTFVTAHPAFDLSVATHAIKPAVKGLPNQFRQIVGVFGWSETTMPQVMYALWGLLALGVGGLALWYGTRRERIALVGLGVIIVIADLGIATVIEAPIGFGMQARYILPLAVGLPMLAGEILNRHRDRPGRRRGYGITTRLEGRIRVVTFLGIAFLQLVAFVANLHRYVVGQNAPWKLPWDGSWRPAGGIAVWAAFAIVGVVCLALTGLVSRGAKLLPVETTPVQSSRAQRSRRAPVA
jgi:hypothetical protein